MKIGYIIASNHVAKERRRVGYLYREEPDNESDSGWRVFTGEETQEYADDAGYFAMYNASTILEIDPTIREVLGSTPPVAFEPDTSGEFVQVNPRSRDDIRGLEYDWLCSDESGCVALFSTAGASYAPAELLRDTDAHDIAIEAVLALPATTEATCSPDVAPGHINTWRLVAERGLYAYDGDPNGGPYRLVAAPAVPVRVDALPAFVARVAARIGCAFRFENRAVVTGEMLGESRQPGETED